MLKEAKTGSGGRSLGLEILLFILVFFVSQTIVSIPVSIATVIAVFTSDAFRQMVWQITAGGEASFAEIMEISTEFANHLPSWVLLVQLFSTVLATGTAILYCRFIEKRSVPSMGLRRRHILREYGMGTIVGILLISLCVGICVITGSMSLRSASFSPIMWVLFLLGFLLQGMNEEVICRGYMMVSISRRNSLVLAVLTNSIVFSLLHIGNPGVGPLPLLNIALFGILESVYVLKRGDLWGACAIHSLWNFFQGNVFGVKVSGMDMAVSPLTATLTDGRDWLNGGDFGLEGGLAATLVIGLATLLMIFFLPSSKEEIVPEPLPETA